MKIEPKVLVACPTHLMKKYAMRYWIDNVKSFTYSNLEIFMVDNSPTEAFMKQYVDEIPIKHLKSDAHLPHLRITQSMEVIRRKAMSENFDWWFNLEIDVIPQDKDIIEKMLDMAQKNDFDLLSHCYPARYDDQMEHQGIGFAMISRKIFSQIDYNQAGNVSPDGFMWGKVRKYSQFKMAEIWNIFNVKHLTLS